jgi:hypothetical protein
MGSAADGRTISSLAAFALLLLLAHLSAAENGFWDLRGKWTIQQSNNIAVDFHLRQHQTTISGTASYLRRIPPNKNILATKVGREFYENGTVIGGVTGNQVVLRVKWGYGETGVYNGTISLDGKMTGSAFIAEDPNNAARKSTWSSSSGEARWSKPMP